MQTHENIAKEGCKDSSFSNHIIISHSAPIFKRLKFREIEDLYTVQLYKLYYILRNNLLSSYFHTFTPYYYNDQHTHDLRYTLL